MPDINGLSFGSTIDTLGNALTGAAMQNTQNDLTTGIITGCVIAAILDLFRRMVPEEGA